MLQYKFIKIIKIIAWKVGVVSEFVELQKN